MDKDTPGTLEERARAIAASVTDDAFLAKAIIAGEVDYFRVVRSALAALTEAADEIASLRARVEVMREALDWALPYARNQATDDEGLAFAEMVLEQPARQALKDTP